MPVGESQRAPRELKIGWRGRLKTYYKNFCTSDTERACPKCFLRRMSTHATDRMIRKSTTAVQRHKSTKTPHHLSDGKGHETRPVCCFVECFTMVDNMANGWGCCLVLDSSDGLRGNKRSADAMDSSGEHHAAFTTLFHQVRRDLNGKFLLEHVSPNGSDANLFAVNSVTRGDNNGCLVASGSYVAGDGGPLATWTSSTFDIEQGPSFVAAPNEVATQFTKEHTVALPYHIPGAKGLTMKKLQKYEDVCLFDLHARCLVQKMKGTPVTALLLEITLANNGATLSDRALKMLGMLAAHHGFQFVDDEIMTGGRTGRMLECLGKPKEFVDAIACVTMGKWLGMGLVLVSKDHREKTRRMFEAVPRRGVSTNMKCDQAIKLWQAAALRLGRTEQRRAQAIKKLNMREADCWGAGIHIFAPVARVAASRASKVRFLPLLEDTPFDSIKVLRTNVLWTKEYVNDTLINGVQEWLGQYYITTEADKAYHKLVVQLAQKYTTNRIVSTKEVTEEIMGVGFHTKATAAVLTAAEDAGLCSRVKVTADRLRRWEIHDLAIPPWSL